jgi:6-phosphogluconolactonase
MDKPQIIIEDNPAKAARATANIFVRSCLKSISKRGRFAVGLSGGSTPRLFHRVLAKEPIRSEIHWDGYHIFWV